MSGHLPEDERLLDWTKPVVPTRTVEPTPENDAELRAAALEACGVLGALAFVDEEDAEGVRQILNRLKAALGVE